MKYTLRQLQVFLATAHFENVSKAADNLAMSQSAASGALKDLERQFEIQLFDRVGKRLQLNELGRLLRPKAESLLEQAGALEQALEQHSDAGTIKLGATLTIGNYLAIGLMTQFMQENPGATISLEVANTVTIAQRVANFELDIGLIEGELTHSDLLVTPWKEDDLVVFSAPGHALARKRKVTDKDLLAADWILRESGSGTRQAFERAMQGLLPQLEVLLELQHTEAIKRAVEAELGISCLSEIALREAFRRGSLVPLKVGGKDFHRRFYLIMHRQKYISAGLEKWLDVLRR